MNKWGAISGILTGMTVIVVWATYLSEICVETGPAFAFSLIAIIIVSRLTGAPSEEWKDKVTQEMEAIKKPL
jgi:Na+/proline symporter